ncbi:MAG TPA: ETEC_3214 domain-containing protein [Baekduia sp.]|uniref:ETEC_3214 domain-containing protein n=1 Tax=Baekduia sp. TaxID=2600305 RepID=UPI002C9EC72A|nr:ETEC_3214 domain-containing protein [Baekduia sp.]HMJ34778.1 ETEC_3214 domain-containing protein [Baekduia sp.]
MHPGPPLLLAASTGDLVVGVATVAAAVVAIVASAGGLAAWYRRTLGRRRHGYARLARLGTAAQLSFFEAILGEPPAIQHTVIKEDFHELITSQDARFDHEHAVVDEYGPRQQELRSPQAFTVSIFVDRDFYVQTISNEDATVLAFSVTTRSRKFAPTFSWPPPTGLRHKRRLRRGLRFEPLFRVKLGHSRFSDSAIARATTSPARASGSPTAPTTTPTRSSCPSATPGATSLSC